MGDDFNEEISEFGYFQKLEKVKKVLAEKIDCRNDIVFYKIVRGNEMSLDKNN